jgi:hypothetical protein
MIDAQRCMRFKLAMPDSVQYILAEATTMADLWLKVEMHLTTILSIITTDTNNKIANLHSVANLPVTTPVNPTTSLFSAQSTKPKQNTHSQQQHSMLEVQIQHKFEKLQMEQAHSQELMNERLEYLRADQQKKQYGNKQGAYKPGGFKQGGYKQGAYKPTGFKTGGYKAPGAPSYKPKGSFQGNKASSPGGNKTLKCHHCGGPHVMRLCHRLQDSCKFLEEQPGLDRAKLAEQSRQREKYASLSDLDMHNLHVMRQAQMEIVDETQEECVEESQEECDDGQDDGQECDPEYDQQYEENSTN